MRYRFIGKEGSGLYTLLNTVTLKVPKSDGTLLVIENIVKNETIFEVDDPNVIKLLNADQKYETV